jgi:MinD-like ATPase involved in chromosome partitioning or flagellar assembly
LLKQHLMDHGGGRIVASVVAAEDAVVNGYDVFVADDTTSFLGARFVADLQHRGVSVVGVYDPVEGEGSGKQRLLDLRVDEIVEADSPPAEFLRVLARASLKSLGESDRGLSALVADLAGPGPVRPDPFEASGEHSQRGRIVVVAGASGGVGATEVAIGLTALVASRAERPVLVDADDVGPSIAQRLGLPVNPNLRTAIDMVHSGDGTVEDVLIGSPDHFDVIGGIANRRDWFELRPGDLSEAVLGLARVRDHVIVNVSSRLEDLPAMGGPARYGVSRSMLTLADVVVLVANPTPIGVARVLDWIAEAKPLIEATPLFVTFNAYRGGRFKAAEIETELRRVYQPGAIAFIPYDRSLIHATWQGLLPDRGPFLRAVAVLAASAIPPARPAPKHRERR